MKAVLAPRLQLKDSNGGQLGGTARPQGGGPASSARAARVVGALRCSVVAS